MKFVFCLVCWLVGVCGVWCVNLTESSRNVEDKKSNATSLPSSYYNYPFAKFVLPECAAQQVCNAVHTRLNRIHSLCACPDKYVEPCSISFKNNDQHTIELVTGSQKKALTLVKTCEPISSVRECKGPQDWAILALQNVRTGKSHYLVTCRCMDNGILEGPISHENPPYAKIPGIRVFGMICHQKKRFRKTRDVWRKHLKHSRIPLPTNKIRAFLSNGR